MLCSSSMAILVVKILKLGVVVGTDGLNKKCPIVSHCLPFSRLFIEEALANGWRRDPSICYPSHWLLSFFSEITRIGTPEAPCGDSCRDLRRRINPK